MTFDDPIPGLVTALTKTGTGVIAHVPVRKGQQLYRVSGCLCSKPTQHSVQIASTLHIEPGEATWRYINHSCDPNLVIDFASWRFRAVRDIGAGEELSFNYLNTERELTSPFVCTCRAADCFGLIGGYAKLDADRQELLREHRADHLHDLGFDTQLQRFPNGAERRPGPTFFGLGS